MTRVVSYPGPFRASIKPIVDRPGRSLILGPNARLEDRLLFLARHKQTLTTSQNPRELQAWILEQGLKNFHFVGKSVVFAGFQVADKFTALTIPESLPPFPQNASRYIGAGFPKRFPLQHDLVQLAIQRKKIVEPEKPENKDYLAVPLVSESGDKVFGVLLFSNRYSQRRIKFTPDDIVIARLLSEAVSAAISPLIVG